MRIATLSTKSQLTLHTSELRMLGVQRGDRLSMTVVDGTLRLRRLPGTPRRTFPAARRQTAGLGTKR